MVRPFFFNDKKSLCCEKAAAHKKSNERKSKHLVIQEKLTLQITVNVI